MKERKGLNTLEAEEIVQALKGASCLLGSLSVSLESCSGEWDGKGVNLIERAVAEQVGRIEKAYGLGSFRQ